MYYATQHDDYHTPVRSSGGSMYNRYYNSSISSEAGLTSAGSDYSATSPRARSAGLSARTAPRQTITASERTPVSTNRVLYHNTTPTSNSAYGYGGNLTPTSSSRGRSSTPIEQFQSSYRSPYAQTSFENAADNQSYSTRTVNTPRSRQHADPHGESPQRSRNSMVAKSPRHGVMPTRRRAPSMDKDRFTPTFIPPQAPEHYGKLVVVLDLDETLVYAREGPIHMRPGCAELLHMIHQHCEVVVWTAGEKDYAQSVLAAIDPHGVVDHCIYRHHKWWTGRPGYVKNLNDLGRPLDRVIMLENTPDCLRDHPANGLLVTDFVGRSFHDKTLFEAAKVIQELLKHPNESVPNILAESRLVARRQVNCDSGGSILVWTLASDHQLGSIVYQQSRYNRDLYGATRY